MKKKAFNILMILSIVAFTGCKKFIDIVPKGKKIPQTFADFDAFILDEQDNQLTNVAQAIYLLNDRFETAANLNYSRLSAANYNWDTTANRIALNNASEQTYYIAYRAINTSNLLIAMVPSATDGTAAQKNALIAQAKLLRAINYFILANYYADTYEAQNSATKRSVPLITSADVDAPYKQVTIQEIYDFMLKDIEEALPNLPVQGETMLHPNKGAGYAFKARVLLQMGQYTGALSAANEALTYNAQLFDWTQFYASYQSQIESPGVYINAPSPMGYDYIENYYYRHGTTSFSGREVGVRIDRAARFETGDARFASRWKLRTVGSDTYYYGITGGLFNYGGLTTTEIYLIKAECLARANDIIGAMDALNAVRIKRIQPAVYVPLNATTETDAINLIMRTKYNELILSQIPFADRRRLNKDPQFATTLVKTEDSNTISLAPNANLWTMPFPLGAIQNPGNGSFVQNVSK